MKNLKIAAAVLSIALAIAAPSASSVFAQATPAIVVATGETLISSGNFSEIHAPTTGSVAIIKLANGKQVLRMDPDWSYIDFLNAASSRIDLIPAAKRVFNSNGLFQDRKSVV